MCFELSSIMNYALCIGLELPGEKHWDLDGLGACRRVMPTLRVEHDPALPCPTAVVVADIDYYEAAHSFGSPAEIACQVGHVGYLAGFVFHHALVSGYYAYGDSVAIAHEGVCASYCYATHGA